MIPFPASPFASVPPGAPPRPPVTPMDLSHYILTTFPGVQTNETEDGRYFHAGSDHHRPFVILTNSKEKENAGPTFCIRLRVSVERGQALTSAFSGEVTRTGLRLNSFLPDKEGAEGGGICIFNPAGFNLPILKACLIEAYGLAARRLESAA